MVGAGAASVLLSLGAVSRVINPYLSSALQPPMLVLPPAPQVEDELKGDASQQEFVTKISKKEKEKLKAKNNAGLNSNSSTQNGNGNGNNKNNKNNNTDSLAFAAGYGLANVLNKNKGGKSGGNSNTANVQTSTSHYNGHMLGANGEKIKNGGSQTLTNQHKPVEGRYRVDVENIDPGKRPANLHLQDQGDGNKKYVFDPNKNQFVDGDTKELAPKRIQKLLENDEIKKAINKGMKFLGEETWKPLK